MRSASFVAVLLLAGCMSKQTVTTQTGNGPITTQITTGSNAPSTALITAAVTAGVTVFTTLNTDILQWLGLKARTVPTPPSGTTKAGQ